jgi:glycosyltransferase involved in cell wall biosynthesis
MRILVIPSWYPTPKKPLNGSFFQEQAQFLQEKASIEIRVLYGEKKSYHLLRWLWIWVQSFLRSTWSVSQSSVVQNPQAYGFDLPANRRVPESLQIDLELRLFRKAYAAVAGWGWVPDLIHAQSGMDAGVYARDLSISEKIPFALIEHQVVMFHHYSRIRARLVLESYRTAKRLGAVSEAQRRQMVIHEAGCTPVVVPNLLDQERYYIKKERGSSRFHVITMMYNNPIKGFRIFFEAMKFLKEWQIDIRYTVIGDGGAEFGEMIREFDIESMGQLLGDVKRQDIPSLLSDSHLYVCSSDFETFGNAPREAMLSGIPVVSTANGGVEESIKPETGLVVPVRDARALAEGILKIKTNHASYDSNMIRKLAIEQCGREAFLRSMLSFYKI